ncbi:hypothetical protein BC835DRAFT_1416575 [Cytidiella melzeri]|nr:hypothetical protein BC835DRAFT_1416575 [Cytidiella melzeri]
MLHVSVSFRDGLVASSTPDGKYVITSPNMSYVPVPCWGQVSVSMKADGRFGMEDPLLWPQIYDASPSCRLLSCMPRFTHPHHSKDVWDTLTQDDMQIASSNIPGMFIMTPARLATLRKHLADLHHDLEERDKTNPPNSHLRWLYMHTAASLECLSIASSSRDLIRQFANLERYYCMVVACMTHERLFSNLDSTAPPRIVRPDLMGCFTTSPLVAAHMYTAGVPVWYMRLADSLSSTDIIVSHGGLQQPSGIVTSNGSYTSDPIFVGSAGRFHFDAILYHCNVYIDLESKPFPASFGLSQSTAGEPQLQVLSSPNSSQGGAMHSGRLGTPPPNHSQAGPSRHGRSTARNQPYQQRRPAASGPSNPIKAKAFDEDENPCIPPILPVWKDALRHASTIAIDSNNPSIGFWVPQPAHVLASSQDRRHRYVLNWLKAREGWYYIIRHLGHREPLPARWWRAYLDDGFDTSAVVHTSKSRDRGKVLEVLSAAFRGQNIATAELRPAWFGGVVTTVDDQLCRDVAWELSEVGFRVELLMLDMAFFQPDRSRPAAASQRADWMTQVFQTGHMLYLTSLPTCNIGLSSSDRLVRATSLEGLRLLMECWPNRPELLKTVGSLTGAPEETLQTIEPIIAQFYCETFVKRWGRALSLPRQRFPSSSL